MLAGNGQVLCGLGLASCHWLLWYMNTMVPAFGNKAIDESPAITAAFIPNFTTKLAALKIFGHP